MPSIRPGGTNSLKKIDFFTPPRTCTSPGGRCTRADFSLRYGILRRPTTTAPAQQHVGAPPGRSSSQGSLLRSVCGGFIARLGRKITPAPPAVYAHSAVLARPLTPKGRAGTATCAPATCQISLATQMVTRKNEIFRFGLLLLLSYV